jgi:ATP phosphoribosyltransferase
MNSQLRIALPSKGMEEQTLQFLRACGLAVDRTNQRQYRARMRGLPTGPAEVVFQRATDVFDEVEHGTVDLGITGYDIVAEHRSEEDGIVMVHGELGYSRCALVLAVPEGWIDVTSIADLAEVAVELRGSAGHDLRVATKYVNLTRQFLYNRGITAFRLVEVSGALEAAPSLDTADIICDLTSSGVTLRENRLKTITGGTVVDSQACIIGHRDALRDDPCKLQAVGEMLELIEAYQRARGHMSLTANIRGESAAEVARQVNAVGEVAGLRGPTVGQVFPKAGEATLGHECWFSVTVVVTERLLHRAVEVLRQAGATDINATEVRYFFQDRSWTFEALKHALEAAA